MRGELSAFFQSISVSEDSLLFLDTIFAKISQQEQGIYVFLVDHNDPSITWSLHYPKVSVAVAGIIDHHEDVNKYLDANPRIIYPTGSCSTLVLEYLHKQLSNSDRFTEAQNWLVYPLVLDTICFQRDSPLDLAWGSKILIGKPDASREELQVSAKSLMTSIDASLLSDDKFELYDVLHKDYKLYMADGVLYGISTIRVDIGNFIRRVGGVSESEAVVRRFMKDENICVFCITVAVRDPRTHQFYQQICLFSADANRFNPLALKAELMTAGCVLVPIQEYAPALVFSQNNPRLSRKQIQPAMHRCMLRK
jgi:exopolyphosphatase